jgi:hypothetical protein
MGELIKFDLMSAKQEPEIRKLNSWLYFFNLRDGDAFWAGEQSCPIKRMDWVSQ